MRGNAKNIVGLFDVTHEGSKCWQKEPLLPICALVLETSIQTNRRLLVLRIAMTGVLLNRHQQVLEAYVHVTERL